MCVFEIYTLPMEQSNLSECYNHGTTIHVHFLVGVYNRYSPTCGAMLFYMNICLSGSLVPRPLPAFQCCTRKREGLAWELTSHAECHKQ